MDLNELEQAGKRIWRRLDNVIRTFQVAAEHYEKAGKAAMLFEQRRLQTVGGTSTQIRVMIEFRDSPDDPWSALCILTEGQNPEPIPAEWLGTGKRQFRINRFV